MSNSQFLIDLTLAIHARCDALRRIAAECRQGGAENAGQVADELDRQASYLISEIDPICRHHRAIVDGTHYRARGKKGGLS